MQQINQWYEWFVAGVPPLTNEWMIALIVAGVLFLLANIYTYTTQAGVIARATKKEAVRQPVFLLMLALALVLILVFTFLPFFTLGEDVKMMKECGLATILFSGVMLAVWTASTSIAAEIEGKTAMTLLSKPINRRQFIVGKYVGIVHCVVWLLVPIVIAFLALIYYKVGYDAKEMSAEYPGHAERLYAVLLIIPGIFLIFLEICVIAAISVAISTRVPMVVNIISCFTIYIIGHLTPVLVQTGAIKIEIVSFMARLIATVFPSLEVFNAQAAITTGSVVPPAYLAYSTGYCAAYSAIAILVAFILFEDRDLA